MLLPVSHFSSVALLFSLWWGRAQVSSVTVPHLLHYAPSKGEDQRTSWAAVMPRNESVACSGNLVLVVWKGDMSVKLQN